MNGRYSEVKAVSLMSGFVLIKFLHFQIWESSFCVGRETLLSPSFGPHVCESFHRVSLSECSTESRGLDDCHVCNVKKIIVQDEVAK